MIFLRTTSHRSREKLDRALGRHPQYYYTMRLGGCLAEVTEEEYNLLISTGKELELIGCNDGKLGIKGITLYRGKEIPRKCWSTFY